MSFMNTSVSAQHTANLSDDTGRVTVNFTLATTQANGKATTCNGQLTEI
jgi:hypothetical protein